MKFQTGFRMLRLLDGGMDVIKRSIIPLQLGFPLSHTTTATTTGSLLLHHVSPSPIQASFFGSVATESAMSKNSTVRRVTRKLKSRKEIAAIRAVIESRKSDALIVEDEAMRILKEVEISIRDVEGSKFYRKLHRQLSSSKVVERNLTRVLGSNSHLQMVFYAIGSLEFCYKSQYQLAIALLLRRDFSHWIGGKIEVYDPVMTAADVIVLEKLGLEVLSVNEECRRRVEKPTLFFMPYPTYNLVGNLLEANWRPSQMNQIVFLTLKFSDTLARCQSAGKNAPYFTAMQYIQGIQDFTKEIAIKANYGQHHYINIFYKFALHCFDVDPEIDLDDCLLPEIVREREKRKNLKWEHDEHKPNESFSHFKKVSRIIFLQAFKEDQDDLGGLEWFGSYGVHRGPSKYRRVSRPPPPGWVKLNFSGKGCDEDSPAGYGGIFHSDKKEPLVIYSGSLGDADETVANVEALRHGLRCLKSLSPPVRKLVVEGNDLSVIRWANRRPQPPVRIREALLEISRLLKGMKCIIYHIYEEPNLPSIVLAKKGAKLDTSRRWISPSSVCLEDKASLPQRVDDPEFDSSLEPNAKLS